MTMVISSTATSAADFRGHAPVRFAGGAPHIGSMTTLTHTHIRRVPTKHRITVMETAEDQHYYGRTYDCYPNDDGTITVSRGLGHHEERVPFMGMYLVEELTSEGKPNGIFELLTPEEFKEQYVELGDPNLIYGFRSVGGKDINVGPGTLESARNGVTVFQAKHPLVQFEVVSLPRHTDEDDATWTVVGR